MALLASAAPAALGAQGPTTAPALAFEHVTVVDVRDGRLAADQTVVVTGNRITAVGTAGAVGRPSGARAIDASGKYLIPGLWDMHVHAWTDSVTRASDFPLYMANGLTGVRLMWGDRPAVPGERFPTREVVSRWQRDIAAGRLLGPRIVAASNILDGPHPVWRGSLAIRTAEEGRRAVIEAKQKGADFIKVYNGLPRHAYFAVMEEARRQRIPVAGHVPDAVTAAEASDAGQVSIEHLEGVLTACSSRPAEYLRLGKENAARPDPSAGSHALRWRARMRLLLEPYDERACAALLNRFVRNGTWQVPTLVVWRPNGLTGDSAFTGDPRLEYLPPDLREFWTETITSRWDSGEDFALWRQLFIKQQEIVAAMYRAGVPLLAGSDEPNPYVFPGFSLHDELALLVQAGLTPLEALRAATLNPARFLKATDSLGTVEQGKLADLVLLDGDPLSAIRNTARIRAVVANGRYLDRSALDALLGEAKRTAAASGGRP